MEVYTSNRTVQLSEGTQLNEESIKQLDNFFSSIQPSDLRNTLLEIYHNYVIHEHQAFPIDFDRMAVHMYLLIDLLRRLDVQKKRSDEEHSEVQECDLQWLLCGNSQAALIREN